MRMRLRTCLLILTALALPVATVALGEGTAVAGKVTGAGTTSCHFGGSIDFNPPLTSAGSTKIKKEVTTVNATLSGCTGGTPPGPNTAASIKPIKTKTAAGAAGGTCASFESAASSVVVKVKVKWAGEKASKFDISGLHVSFNAEGEAGFTGSFSVSGSYGGSGTVAAYLTNASTAAIAACSGSVSSLQLDSSTSSGSI